MTNLLFIEGPIVFVILLFLGMIVFFWLLPIIIIASSRKVSGREKLIWLLAVFFISWFAWIFFLILAPIDKDEP